MKCSNCNTTDHEPTAKFCHVCGALLENVPANEAPEILEVNYYREEFMAQPFGFFPVIQEELLASFGSYNFEDYYWGYKSALDRIKELSDYIMRLLTDEDVKQSVEYASFKVKAEKFFSDIKTSHCAEVKTLKETAERLSREVSGMRSKVISDRKEAEHMKTIKKNKRIAFILTIVVAVILLGLFWLTLLSSYSERLPLFAKILSLVCYIIVGIAFLAFLWSHDFLEI